jgi:hypothetical protein
MKFSRSRLLFGLFVLAVILLTETVTAHLKVAAWPAYLVWIMFFLEHMNPQRVAHILVGTITAMVLVLLAPRIIGALAQIMGPEGGRLVYILAAVYAIFAFGEMIPVILNNFTFLVLTVAAVALSAPNAAPLQWLVVAVLGGGLMILATLLVGRAMGLPRPPLTQPP